MLPAGESGPPAAWPARLSGGSVVRGQCRARKKEKAARRQEEEEARRRQGGKKKRKGCRMIKDYQRIRKSICFHEVVAFPQLPDCAPLTARHYCHPFQTRLRRHSQPTTYVTPPTPDLTDCHHCHTSQTIPHSPSQPATYAIPPKPKPTTFHSSPLQATPYCPSHPATTTISPRPNLTAPSSLPLLPPSLPLPSPHLQRCALRLSHYPNGRLIAGLRVWKHRHLQRALDAVHDDGDRVHL